jgi:hypothetical protein
VGETKLRLTPGTKKSVLTVDQQLQLSDVVVMRIWFVTDVGSGDVGTIWRRDVVAPKILTLHCPPKPPGTTLYILGYRTQSLFLNPIKKHDLV